MYKSSMWIAIEIKPLMTLLYFNFNIINLQKINVHKNPSMVISILDTGGITIEKVIQLDDIQNK